MFDLYVIHFCITTFQIKFALFQNSIGLKKVGCLKYKHPVFIH